MSRSSIMCTLHHKQKISNNQFTVKICPGKDLKSKHAMHYIYFNTGIFPQGIGFICHLSSYSFHILVMTFTVETVVDWPVFPSAVRIFVTATEGHTLWF